MKSTSWMKGAPCIGKSDIFFDETHARIVREARKICGDCDKHVQCLAYALANDEVGVWAGTTTNQRAKILREKRKEAKNADDYTKAV